MAPRYLKPGESRAAARKRGIGVPRGPLFRVLPRLAKASRGGAAKPAVQVWRMKAILQLSKALSILFLTVGSASARADAGPVLGILSDLVALSQFGGSILGKTSVQPAYRLYSWQGCHFGNYGGVPFGYRRRLQYSPWTSHLFHYTEQRNPDLSWRVVTTDPFPLDEVRRHNKTCDLYGDGRYLYKTFEDFTLMVWAMSVVKSGAFPPAGPYPAFLKGETLELSENCAPDPGTWRITRSDLISLDDEGWRCIKMPIVQRSYRWGMLCWVGRFYDY